MRVLYDPQIFRQQRYGGISRYFCELTKRVNDAPDARALVLAPRHLNEYLRKLGPGLVAGWYSEATGAPKRAEEWAIRATQKAALTLFRPQLVHETYFWGGPVARKAGVRRVLTIYDMIHERFPSMFAADNRTAQAKRSAAERADHILCISEATRRDAIEFLGVPESKLSVTYLSASMRAPSGVAAACAVDKPYVLYVGERGGYKNFRALARALATSQVLHDVSLLCCGGGDLTDAEWSDLDTIGLARQRVSHQRADDYHLARLYANALCFVYPSLYEGFGIPPLEAMQCGCPVVCSSTSSIPEVVGEAGAYFDPHDFESLRAALESVAVSESRRNELRQLGRLQVARFSWDNCAAQTLATYRTLL